MISAPKGYRNEVLNTSHLCFPFGNRVLYCSPNLPSPFHHMPPFLIFDLLSSFSSSSSSSSSSSCSFSLFIFLVSACSAAVLKAHVREKQAQEEVARLQDIISKLVDEAGARTRQEVDNIKKLCNQNLTKLMDELQRLELVE